MDAWDIRPTSEILSNLRNVEYQTEIPKKVYKTFDLLVMFTHGIGITMVALNAFYFGSVLGGFSSYDDVAHPELCTDTVDGCHNHGFINMHGFLMMTAFIFFQGEAFYFGSVLGGFSMLDSADHPELCTDTVDGCHNHSFINMHGFLMMTAFIFFQGEALIVYRVLRHEYKVTSKTIHVLLHCAAIICAVFGVRNIVKDKKMTGNVQNYSFHSWIGIAIMFSYGVQFVVGFVNFAYPKTSLWVRQMVMPSHRTFGSILFHASVANVLMGHTRYICFSTDDPFCYALHTCKKRLGLILNFAVIFIILYAICVIYIISRDSWKRQQTPDEKEHKQ